MLEAMGFCGQVWCSEPTSEILGPILHGSARLQAIRVFEHRAAKSARVGTGVRRLSAPPPPVDDEPPAVLYTASVVDALMRRVRGLEYGRAETIASGVSLRLLDAAHVIGSASVELTIGRGMRETVVVFSGDLGAAGAPLLAPLQSPARADVLVLESTYGDRSHPAAEDALEALARVVGYARSGRSRLVIPTFTLGRAQQLLYRLGQLSRSGRLGVPVYLDSKMAVTASEAYARHPERLEPGVASALRAGAWPLQFPELMYVQDRADSRRLNTLRGAGVIIAGSGFCHGGPIVHHLAHALWRPDAHVLLIGHQPAGTTAQQIAAGHPEVLLGDRLTEVRARVHTLGGFSGHADREGLLAYVSGMAGQPGLVVLNHGDDGQRLPLARRLAERRLSVETPGPGGMVEA
jgi:metallo-beta-lactamase family protein